MPADYKYEFISMGRLKALRKGADDLGEVYRRLVKAQVLSPELIEKLNAAYVFIRRGAGDPLDEAGKELLKKTFGEGLGEEPLL